MNKFLIKMFTITFLLSYSLLTNIFAQNKNTEQNIPIIKSNVASISIQDGTDFRKNYWTLTPESKPDTYKTWFISEEPHKVIYYTDIDSISFMVKPGEEYNFIINWNGKSCYQRIVGEKFSPAAVFDEEYIENRKGKIFISIPDVYELVNVAMAISKFGKEKKYYIYKKSDYYKKVLDYFDKYSKNEFVKKLDSILAYNSNYYASLKMNGNAFLFDENGKIQQSKVFDRTGFRDQKFNNLLPYLEQMQSFANESNFLNFYRQNSDTYKRQIAVFRDSINIRGMQEWLDRNFPGSSSYDSYNIIFSPLVAYNQSSTWFENNGFKELQPHVNFPYREDIKSLFPISKEAEYIYRGNIVFTEINHGYINPEGEKYGSRITDAVSNRKVWVDSTADKNYYSGARTFYEYMNWGLISLRILDYVPDNEQEKLIERMERGMVNGRKFLKFKEFNQFLISLYKKKSSSSTIADLYPQIISWFENINNGEKSY